MSATPSSSAAAKPSLWEQHRARLDAYASAKVNYDFSRQSEYTTATG